ncbi:MAG: prepilin-type N-terminal cleavage/methylation domain-containing protein [Rhizomicrobium sp.]
MRTRPETPSQAGFTLTELLVSLVLLAFVSLLLLPGISAGRNLWRGAAERATTAEAIDGAQNALRSRLERLYPITRNDSIPPYAAFDGSDSTLMFYASAPANLGRQAPRRYTLSVTDGGDLVLSSRSDLWGRLPESASGPPLVEILLHGVQSLDASYFDPSVGGNGAWRDSWHKKPLPPALIRIQVNFSPGDHRWWPDLIVDPLANIDTECTLSRNTNGCAGRS